MIDKFNKISNPLTIIAIFAGLAEVAGTTALFGVDKDIQATFIWFVMLFPTLIVALFFITLNFNPSVLYAPSDFENDEGFLEALKGRTSVESKIAILEEGVSEFSKHLEEVMGTRGLDQNIEDKNETKKTIRDELNSLKEKVSVTKEAAQKLSAQTLPKSRTQALVLDLIENSSHPLSANDLSSEINIQKSIINASLYRLVEKGFIVRSELGYTAANN